MQAIILLAGYGSRLNRNDLPHKVLLPFGEETLLSRHLECLEKLNLSRICLVLGHNKEQVKNYVQNLNLDLPIHFLDNDLYRTTGNTLSMVIGLRACTEDVLILDGDVLYPTTVFLDYVRKSKPTSFALVSTSVDNEEAAKVLFNSTGTIHAFITKRHLTAEERAQYIFGGEAIGFFKLAGEDAKKFIELYDAKESEYAQTLWEIPFTEFAREVKLYPWEISEDGCFEIDTQEDYDQALASFNRNPSWYV